MFPCAGQLKRRGIDSQKAEIAVRSSLCDERKQAHQPVSGPPPPLGAGASPRTPGTVGGCAPTHFHRRDGYLRPTTRGGRWGPTAAAGSACTPAAAAPACRCGRACSVTQVRRHTSARPSILPSVSRIRRLPSSIERTGVTYASTEHKSQAAHACNAQLAGTCLIVKGSLGVNRAPEFHLVVKAA